MLKFQLATKQDRREAAIIEQRRRCEEERKSRIFNSRYRILGVDCQALENQIKEKNCNKQSELERENKYIAEEQRRTKILQIKNDELQQERRRIENEIIEYHNKYQRKEDTREFDLNDPKQILKSLPARIGNNDPRLGISSAQKFIGEDLMGVQRKRAQQEQQRAWLLQQMDERRRAETDKEKVERIQQEAIEARDQRALYLDGSERECRQKIQSSIAEFNRMLAAEQLQKKLKQKTEEQEDNLAEIYNNLTSDMLTENPECANSRLGLNRIVTANYKGMSPSELENIRRIQQNQLADNKKITNNTQMIDLKWEQMNNNFADITLAKEMELKEKERIMKNEIQRENQQLAVQQNAKIDHINNILYTNPPTKEYFEQFNTTSR